MAMGPFDESAKERLSALADGELDDAERASACAAWAADPAVRRDWRRRGIASLLKRTVLAWAAGHGLRDVYTWTQNGNAAMRAVNESLGYTTRSVGIRVRGRLPLPR